MEYELIRSKRKSVSITVTAECRVVVRAPLKTSENVINAFIKSKISWIEKNILKAKQKYEAHKDFLYIEGEEFLFLGDKYKLKFSDTEKKVALNEGFLILPSKYKKNPQKHIKDFYMKESKKILEEKTKNFEAITGRFLSKTDAFLSKTGPFQALFSTKCTGIGVTNARKKWGSCNSKGKINYSFRLIMAPNKAIDYIVVHELCHIGCLNHSKTFWHKVSAVLPDYKVSRAWLKENSRILQLL